MTEWKVLVEVPESLNGDEMTPLALGRSARWALRKCREEMSPSPLQCRKFLSKEQQRHHPSFE